MSELILADGKEQKPEAVKRIYEQLGRLSGDWGRVIEWNHPLFFDLQRRASRERISLVGKRCSAHHDGEDHPQTADHCGGDGIRCNSPIHADQPKPIWVRMPCSSEQFVCRGPGRERARCHGRSAGRPGFSERQPKPKRECKSAIRRFRNAANPL